MPSQLESFYPEHAANLQAYLDLLLKWNKVYNLTSITDSQQMISKHILDSLALLPFITGKRVLDVGTGAGLPGIPLAILLPQHHFTLLDSNGKKMRFLQQVKQSLQLNNVELQTLRIEQFHPNKKFDIITSRAFSQLQDFVVQSQQCLADNGHWLAMKGQHPQNEIAALGDSVQVSVQSLSIPGLDAQRHLVIMKREYLE